MRKVKSVLRAACAVALSASFMTQTVFGASKAAPSQTIDPGEFLSEWYHRLSDKAEQITVPDFEGVLHVDASDGMRDAIAEHYRSEDDMSWIQDAELLLQGTSNDTRGADLETTLFFNDTELYHLQASYDREKNIIYLICPELKDEVLAFPIGNFSADAQTLTGRKVTPEMIADYTTALTELNDLISSISLEMVQNMWMRYAAVLGQYVDTDGGIATITAGSLSEEGHTTTFTLDENDLGELIPRMLRMLAQDELVRQVVESPFAEHAFRLIVKNKAMTMLPKGALWKLAQQALLQAAERDYTWGREYSLTYALDRNGMPIHISASVIQGSIHAELFQLNVIRDGSDHGLEVKIGPVMARYAGVKTNMSSGLLIQGSLKDDMLKETVSVNLGGNVMPLFRIKDLDLRELRSLWPSGVLDVIWKGLEYSCDFFMDEDGTRRMRFLVNGEEWFVVTADLETVEHTELDVIDTSDAFTVDSRKTFFQYMRDASALRMFEKLASGGVPQEYVDMLTDGEAATESSRENTVELE